ncbi:MAG: DUF4837 family protein [Bacteroidales bacterium]|nr:DUF4837 family protein [Bacteroidales bacterium]
MRKLFFSQLLFILPLLLLLGCKSKGGIFTPTASGRPYEVLVVVDHDLWERPAGRALYNALDTDVPGLPQAESSFYIMYSSPKDYDSTLKLLRNILIVDIQPDRYTQAKFSYSNNVYAYPQVIVNIQAPSEKEFEEFVNENKQVIVDFLTRVEMNRQIAILEQKHSQLVNETVRSIFDCEVWVPGELNATKTGEDFFWVGTNKATGDQNLIIYSYPYKDKDTFTAEYFINKRDSVMKVNVPGARPGMYMSTETIGLTTRDIEVQNKYAMETRGLWKVKGDFMGGPFVAHTRVDEKNQRIITAEVFVYAPDKLKRNLTRQIEASLYTLRLPLDREQKISKTENDSIKTE